MSRRDVATETLQNAARAFGLDPAELVFVRDVANVVYGSDDEASVFLRLTHEDDRSPGDVGAEIHWLHFLALEGLPVCRPREASDGSATVRPGEGFTAVVFERVPGHACELEEWTQPVFEQIGRFLGQLHRVSRNYRPQEGAPQRLHWYELDSKERVLASWNADDELVAERFRTIFDKMRDAPVEASRYGLIHGDVHRGNLFLGEAGERAITPDERAITPGERAIAVFDFDDCCRAPLAMDIAHALFYSLWDFRFRPESERTAFAHAFLESLLRGYRREHTLPDSDLARVPELLDLRELAVDAFSHRRRLREEERRRSDEETRRRWDWVRDRLARRAPYVEVDWERMTGS